MLSNELRSTNTHVFGTLPFTTRLPAMGPPPDPARVKPVETWLHPRIIIIEFRMAQWVLTGSLWSYYQNVCFSSDVYLKRFLRFPAKKLKTDYKILRKILWPVKYKETREREIRKKQKSSTLPKIEFYEDIYMRRPRVKKITVSWTILVKSETTFLRVNEREPKRNVILEKSVWDGEYVVRRNVESIYGAAHCNNKESSKWIWVKLWAIIIWWNIDASSSRRYWKNSD